MFNRKELKENAKEHFRKTYNMGILVTFLFSLIGGSAISLNFSIDIDSLVDLTTGRGTETAADYEYIFNAIRNFWNEAGPFLLLLMGIIIVSSFLFQLFIGYPLYVGFKRWYLENRQFNSDIGTVGSTFSSGYLNIIKVMFCRDLIISLWSLLFIVPGIIKSYEYRMVPFLLAENPHMSVSEANGRSRELMRGNKFETFLLDLSFIGWGMLSGFACGLVGILYVAPYIQYTETELYVKLCLGDNYKKPSIEEEVDSYSNTFA